MADATVEGVIHNLRLEGRHPRGDDRRAVVRRLCRVAIIIMVPAESRAARWRCYRSARAISPTRRPLMRALRHERWPD